MTLLVGTLEFCRCGHERRSRHAGDGPCMHVLQRAGDTHVCGCERFEPDPRLPDGEVFVGKVLRQVVQAKDIPCEPIEWETALSELLGQLWVVSEAYDSRSHIRFRVYAYMSIYQDAIDHFRKDRGRHGQHRVADQRHAEAGAAVSDGDFGVARMDGGASRDPGDDPDCWAADGGGLLTVGDRGAARAERDGGGAPAGCAETLDGRAGPAADRRAGGAAAGAGGGARRVFVDCPACGWRSYLEAPNGLPGWHQPESCLGCGARLVSERT